MTERITIISPHIRAPRRPAADRDEIGAARVRSLMRAQARLALVTCSIVVVVLIGLPLLFACVPGLSHVRLLGIRLPWLILCGGVQPVWVAVARRHVRLAERVELDFSEPARQE